MAKVLFIVTDYLPNRNGGTIRVEKLAKYMPAGHELFVLTRKGNFERHEIIGNVNVYRTSEYDVVKFGYKIISALRSFFKKKQTSSNVASVQEPSSNNSRVSDNFIVPDTDIFWSLGSLLKAVRLVSKNKINVVYSSSPSSSVHITGRILKMFFGKKISWIVEFRDPWTFNPFRNPKPSLLERIDHALEKMVIKNADKIIVVSEHFKEVFLEKYPTISSDKIKFIPNGYDPDDFSDLLQSDIQKDHSDSIVITHTGTFYEKRSLLPFLMAFHSLKEQDPQLKLKLVQYGNVDPAAIDYHKKFPNDSVQINAPVPHKESLKAMLCSDWLLLIPGPGKGTMTGKVFEYILAQRPILALVSEGPAKQLIEDSGTGICVPAEDIEGIKDAIKKMIAGEVNYRKADISNEALQKFNRRNIALRVAEEIDNV